MDRIENAARSFILRLYKPSLHLPSCFAARSMLPRLSQAARLFSSPSSPTSIARLPSLLTGMALVHQRSSRTVHTAACLIIGDEVLGGKTVDTNSAYMAKWCFSLGINLKRIEVIEDDESEIMEAVRRMSGCYDLVVTSGGIGPTHDDITYRSIAKAFGLPLKLHKEVFEKMKKLSKPHPSQPNFSWDIDSPALKAKLRMVKLPTDESRDLTEQFIFPHEDLWVPVAVVNGNIHILPGVPRLFMRLLDGLRPHILPRLANPQGNGTTRILISTPLAESEIAAYLTELAATVEPKGIKVGSYPRWGKSRNTVTLVGKDQAFLDSIVAEVAEKVQGKQVTAESDDDEAGNGTGKDS